MTPPLRQRLSQAEIPRLSLRARQLTSGLRVGFHRAERPGAGIEFAGHRPYSPGDDLRHLDRHSLLRHNKYLIRQFHTETERALTLLVDVSPSMNYASAEGVPSKRSFACLLAAALAQLAHQTRDPIALTLLGSGAPRSLPFGSSTEHVEHLIDLLEAAEPEAPPSESPPSFLPALREIGQRAPRGSQLVFLSDCLDTDPTFYRELCALTTRRRSLTVLQVLDEAELSFPFQGAVRLQSPESSLRLDTDAERVREDYQRALQAHIEEQKEQCLRRGAHWLQLLTQTPAREALRRAARALGGQSA